MITRGKIQYTRKQHQHFKTQCMERKVVIPMIKDLHSLNKMYIPDSGIVWWNMKQAIHCCCVLWSNSWIYYQFKITLYLWNLTILFWSPHRNIASIYKRILIYKRIYCWTLRGLRELVISTSLVIYNIHWTVFIVLLSTFCCLKYISFFITIIIFCIYYLYFRCMEISLSCFIFL